MQVKNVVIVNDFNFIQGGASKVAIDTANLLVQKCNDIKVYFFSAVQNGEDVLDKKIINICTDQNEALKDKNKIRGICNGLYNFKAKRVFKKLLKTLDKNSTIIHVHGWTKALSSSVFNIAFKMNFKVVLTLHDYFSSCPNGGYFDYKQNKICKKKAMSWQCIKCNCDSRNYFFKLYRLLRQLIQNKMVRLTQNLQYAVGISDLSISILKSEFNNNIKLEKIYNPIIFCEEKKIDVSQNEYYLYVGRVTQEKGINEFCEIISRLNKRGVVVGDGKDKENLENKYSNIEFVGWKDKKEVKKYMQGARALIVPSLWYEGAPLTPLEAMSMGIPCIISNVCSAKDYIDGENGILIDPYDVENSTKAILAFENNIERISINSYNYFENYKKNNYVRHLTKFYESMMEEI